jgi:hypothetical protein
MSKEIQLTHNKKTTVDDDIPDMQLRVGDLKWNAVQSKSGVWHATCTLVLHRLITKAPPGTIVDHINRDGLYNLRENLRVTTAAGNAANRGKKKSSKYIGVTVVKLKKSVKYRAYISMRGQYRCVGHYYDEETAARERDLAALEAFGENVQLNFPKDKDAYLKQLEIIK